MFPSSSLFIGMKKQESFHSYEHTLDELENTRDTIIQSRDLTKGLKSRICLRQSQDQDKLRLRSLYVSFIVLFPRFFRYVTTSTISAL